MVDIILSAMDSDEVNSISDTVESNQVALLLKTVFYDCASDLSLPEHHTLLELEASGSTDRPTLMTLPSTAVNVKWIKYDAKEDGDTTSNYKSLTYLPFEDFLLRQLSLREWTEDVGQMTFTQNGESFEMMYRTDVAPTYYTTTNDNQVIFDSYDSEVDDTLQKSKTMAFGTVYSTFTLSDNFTPDLNPQQFSYYLNKAKARAFSELKQVTNQEAAGEARRQKIAHQARMRSTPDLTEFQKAPKYGRK